MLSTVVVINVDVDILLTLLLLLLELLVMLIHFSSLSLLIFCLAHTHKGLDDIFFITVIIRNRAVQCDPAAGLKKSFAPSPQ